MTVDHRNGTGRLLKDFHRSLAIHARWRKRNALSPDDLDLDNAEIPELKTVAELIADAGSLPPMLVERLLPDRSLFLLTGKPKAGKSFLALDVADCVSRGTPVLGVLPVNKRGPVLYLAMEDGPLELARRLTQRACPQRDDNGLYFMTDAFSLTESRRYAAFRKRALSLQPSLIVIDTAAEALDIRDWINRSEILAKIAPLRRLARELCTILLVAHNRKAEGDMGDEIAGSNALAGAVDGWISTHKVERRPNGNRRLFLRIEGRGGVGHELIVEMDHTTLRFAEITPDQAEEDANNLRAQAVRRRKDSRHAEALEGLARLGGRATIPELAATMSVNYRVAWCLVRELLAKSAVEEDHTTARPAAGEGRQAPTYRLAATDRSPAPTEEALGTDQ